MVNSVFREPSKFRRRLEVGEVSSKHMCFLSVLEPDFPNCLLSGFHPSPVGFFKVLAFLFATDLRCLRPSR